MAQQILPRKPQRLRPQPSGQDVGVKGRQIVGLLINVDNIGALTPQQTSQCGIEMQVKIAIPHQGQRLQPISHGVRALQTGHAALVAPGRRHRCHKFDAGNGGELLQFTLIDPHQAGLGQQDHAQCC